MFIYDTLKHKVTVAQVEKSQQTDNVGYCRQQYLSKVC